MKHIKHILLLAALLLGSFTASAHEIEVNGIYYNITSEVDLTVAVTCRGDNYSQYSNEYSGAITIPSIVTYNGKTYSVTSIGREAFDGCRSLTSITIPEGVTSIGWYAFRNCSSLTAINIHESVTSIGGYACYGCSSLTTITIPESVTSIGNYAFRNCSSLTAIVVAEGNKFYDSRNGCNALIETSSNTLIQGCSATIIPEGVTSIESHAFRGCSSLTAITLPESVTSIGESAFYGCSSLTAINIPESVTSIGIYVFFDCESLTTITIPEDSKLTSIEDYAFSGCISLTSITIPESVTSIGEYAFDGCSLTSITLPEGVTSIGEWAFAYCSSLTSITCKVVTPPLISSTTFQYVSKSIPVYVPAESVEEYRSATGWKDFLNIIGMETGIENVENPQPAIDDSSIIYDLHGRRVTNPTKGIYIVNGKKVIVK